MPRLAERARQQAWAHEEFSIVCLQGEVSAPESHGGVGRIRAARCPARESPEEFYFEHACGLKQELIAHLGSRDFLTARENALLLGPPGTGTTHLATGPAIRTSQAGHRVLFAAAMIDRPLHHAALIPLEGDSYRLTDRDLGRPHAAATEDA